MSFSHWLLFFNALFVLYSSGIIWFCQMVVYPLFAQVGADEYTTYHRFYTSRIPFPVILPGFAAMLLPIVLIFLHPASVPLWVTLANAACGGVALFVTLALAIPRHNRLEHTGKQEKVIQELILYNWPRTLALTGSAGLTLAMVFLAFVPV